MSVSVNPKILEIAREAALAVGNRCREMRLEAKEEMPFQVFGSVVIPEDGSIAKVPVVHVPLGELPQGHVAPFMEYFTGKTGGVAAFCVTEAWATEIAAPTDTDIDLDTWELPGPVAQMEGAFEVLQVLINTATTNELWYARIRALDDIGEFEQVGETGGGSGPMAHALRAPLPTAAEA